MMAERRLTKPHLTVPLNSKLHITFKTTSLLWDFYTTHTITLRIHFYTAYYIYNLPPYCTSLQYIHLHSSFLLNNKQVYNTLRVGTLTPPQTCNINLYTYIVSPIIPYLDYISILHISTVYYVQTLPDYCTSTIYYIQTLPHYCTCLHNRLHLLYISTQHITFGLYLLIVLYISTQNIFDLDISLYTTNYIWTTILWYYTTRYHRTYYNFS